MAKKPLNYKNIKYNKSLIPSILETLNRTFNIILYNDQVQLYCSCQLYQCSGENSNFE